MKGSDLFLPPSFPLRVPSSAGTQTEARGPAMPADAVSLVQTWGKGGCRSGRANNKIPSTLVQDLGVTVLSDDRQGQDYRDRV